MIRKITDIGTVVSQECLADDVYRMVIKTEIAKLAVSGQFVSVYCEDKTRMLPRPISLCAIDKAEGTITLVYRIAGKGTDEFSRYEAGHKVKLLGPIGNGFTIEGSRPIVIGGGIGVPPMLQLSREFSALGVRPQIVLGYRDSQLFLKEEFEALGDLYIATDDGSAGCHGTVVDAMKAAGLDGDVIYACGPKPMLRAIKQFAVQNDIKCYVSMEERMACGVGACLACVCQTTGVDDHSQVKNARVCVDGPVFLATDIEL